MDIQASIALYTIGRLAQSRAPMKISITPILTLILSLGLVACGSKSISITEDNEVAEREPWFCQMDSDAAEWDCVQSAELASNPQPDRLPSPNQLADATATQVQSTQPGEPTDDVVPASLDRSNPSATSGMPIYQQLAYQPDEPTSLLDLPGDYWAAQIIALPSEEELEEYAAEHNLSGVSAARIAIKDNLFYVLLLGIYESEEIAETAIADLPPPFDIDKPWLRPLQSLQQEIIEGDRVSAENL